MACNEHFIGLVSRISTCEQQSEKFGLSKISSSIIYSISLDALSNSSSNGLLLRHLHKSSSILDNQADSNLDNYACAIESLVDSRPQTRHCRQWKSELSNNLHEFMSELKSDDILTCAHSNRDLSCKSHLLNQDEIKLFLQNTSHGRKQEPNINPADQPVLGSNRSTNVSNGQSNLYTDNISINNATKKILPHDSNNPMTSQQVFVNNYNKPSVKVNQGPTGFKTARSEWINQNQKTHSGKPLAAQSASQKRCLGARGATTKFVSPMITNDQTVFEQLINNNDIEDERLKHIDPKMIELIRSEIIDHGTPIGWDDIAGLEFAKTVIQEAVVWPLLRPDIFTGLRKPPKGILLFGPPGTGKTLIGKCIASQCRATFFSISASSLTSKWLGDGEKMVRALFAVARCHQPAVIFIDEIDSLLTQRSDSEHESTRRIKTEFLVQLDGAATAGDDRLLLIGATNRPQELDEAARRRLVKRLYIPLPNNNARCQIVQRLMSTERHSLSVNDMEEVARIAEGFSGADMQSLCSEAALQPIRAVPFTQIASIQSDQVRPVTVNDFKFALKRVRPSVSGADLHLYEKWDQTYGSGTAGNHQL